MGTYRYRSWFVRPRFVLSFVRTTRTWRIFLLTIGPWLFRNAYLPIYGTFLNKNTQHPTIIDRPVQLSYLPMKLTRRKRILCAVFFILLPIIGIKSRLDVVIRCLWIPAGLEPVRRFWAIEMSISDNLWPGPGMTLRVAKLYFQYSEMFDCSIA